MTRPRHASRQTLAVLAALLERPQSWRHGYELMAATGLKSGTLYPLLVRLHDDGLLEAEWREAPEAGRPPRHAYRLTAAGRAFALKAEQRRASGASPATAPGALA